MNNWFKEHINDKVLYLIVTVITAFLTGLYGKDWKSKLSKIAQTKLISFVTKTARNFGDTWIVRTFKIIFFPTETAIINKLKELLYYYDVDQVLLFYFDDVSTSESYRFWGHSNFSCFKEIRRPTATSEKQGGFKKVPLSAMALQMLVLEDKGILAVECTDTLEGETVFIDTIRSLGNKSSYTKYYNDSDGKPSIIIVLNTDRKCNKITDFTTLDFIGRQIASEFYLIKPKR